MDSDTQTFVLGDVEVKKTGRTAKKQVVGGKIIQLFEVTPVSEYDGTWKKWVQLSSLLTIDGPV